jgi:hypothetical protein
MQWSLRALFLVVAVAALTFGVWRWFWRTTLPNHDMILAFYLVLLSAIAVAALSANARFRGGLIGASVFGVAYLACVLRGGFGVQSYQDALLFVRDVYLGLALLLVSFLLPQLCTMLFWSNRTPEGDSP